MAGVQDVPRSAYSQLRWRLVGPFRGGWATMGTGVPGSPDTFYFSGAGGGIWKTTDAGRTWWPAGDSLPRCHRCARRSPDRSGDDLRGDRPGSAAI